MAVTVPLVLKLQARIDYEPGGPVVVLLVDGKEYDRKPLDHYLACPTCGAGLPDHIRPPQGEPQ